MQLKRARFKKYSATRDARRVAMSAAPIYHAEPHRPRSSLLHDYSLQLHRSQEP